MESKTVRTLARTMVMTSAFLVMLAVSAVAQTTVSSSDIQRLQDEVYQAGGDVSRLRTTDVAAAGRLQEELDTLREEVIYLKVKLRKEGGVARRDYTDVRDRRRRILGGRWSLREQPLQPERHTRRAGNRRPDSIRAVVRHGAGRGSFRGDYGR
jgi:hypothetical protein